MRINGFDTDKNVLIVAEIGNNHEGSFALAQEMVGLAAQAGADAVKFQTIVPELLVCRAEHKRIEQLRKFQLTREEFAALARQARGAGLIFLSTPFDLESARFLNTVQSVFKIASGDNTFYPLIDAVAGFGKPMIVSTGLADLNVVQNLVQRVSDHWDRLGVNPGLALLHCVASYPTPPDQANLGAIATLKNLFPDLVIGYSDHTLGIDAAIFAVAAGARIVEKHFTLDKNHSDFRDHQLSADPAELRRMVDGIRQVSSMLGPGLKEPRPCEANMTSAIRRSIAAATDIPAGTVLTDEHFTWLRPGTGLPPGSEEQLRGRKTMRDLAMGELIGLDDVK
jgi:N,N'-diacetyllegionaminate synthase